MGIGSRLELLSSNGAVLHDSEHASVVRQTLKSGKGVEARIPPEASTVDQGSFYGLLTWLDPDLEAAGDKYEVIRHKLMRMFSYRGCAFAEDLADETFDRVARKLPHIRTSYVGDPTSYFYGVAKKIFMEYLRSVSHSKLSGVTSAKEKEDEEELLQRLDLALSQLEPDDRDLILEYYRGDGRSKINHRKQLAMRAGVHLEGLRTRTSRIRSQLREHLAAEDFGSQGLSLPNRTTADKGTCKGSSTKSFTDACSWRCRKAKTLRRRKPEPIEMQQPFHQEVDSGIPLAYTEPSRFAESAHSAMGGD